MTALIAKPRNSASNIAAATDLRLKDIIKTLPREVFLKDRWKAWTKVIINVALVGLGYWLLAVLPWYLLPLAWIFTGTALTGFFVIGHDCGHRSFANRRWVNDLVGHAVFLPLIYPFHAWRLLHNHHHKHTNKIGEDNAWHPWPAEEYAKAGKPLQFFYRLIMGPMWWIGSISHWAKLHFDWTQFQGKQREQVRFSVLVVLIGGGIGLSTLLATTGIWGVINFWLVPWLVYHFWMSTFTIVHHTTMKVAFKPVSEWNEAEAQLFGTVHCDYPAWVEFLCHDINVHIPHHISQAIPWYNLRLAHAKLKEIWGDSLQESTFSWALMKEITENCQLYHPVNNYQTFQDFHAQNK
jgi:acyl-lipid omega-6 desaturase (Delta-12 desaturase)